jgi:hypothetical protein
MWFPQKAPPLFFNMYTMPKMSHVTDNVSNKQDREKKNPGPELGMELKQSAKPFEAYRFLNVPPGFNIQKFCMLITLQLCVLYGCQNKQ